MSDEADYETSARHADADAAPAHQHPDHRPQHGGQPTGLWARITDAVPPRTVLLGIGVLLLQFAFIISYVGAFHSPKPTDIPVAIVAPEQLSTQLVDAVNGIDDQPVKATAYASEDDALAELNRNEIAGVYVLDPTGQTDRLDVASAGGTATSEAVELVMRAVAHDQGRDVQVNDVVAPNSGDARGLTGFYLVIGWLVGGYLVASLIGVAKGARPATFSRTVLRVAMMVPYAIASGLLGALAVDQILGALPGNFWALAGIGALVSLSASVVTIGLQILMGVIGIGVAILIFVIGGNPSAGGAYQTGVLPGFWSAIHSWLPNGAGVDVVRQVVYFDGHGIAGGIWTLIIWIAAGAIISLGASALHLRRNREA